MNFRYRTSAAVALAGVAILAVGALLLNRVEPAVDGSEVVEAPPALVREAQPTMSGVETQAFGRSAALAELAHSASRQVLSGSVEWLESVPDDALAPDGYIVLELEGGERLHMTVQGGLWRVQAVEGARAKLSHGRLADRALLAWSHTVALHDGLVLAVRPCHVHTLVVRDETGTELSDLRLLARPEDGAAGAHPGPVQPSEMLQEHLASPVRLKEEWLDGRSIWVGAPGRAWQRLELDQSVGETLDVRLQAGVGLDVVLRGRRPAASLLLAARDAERGADLFMHSQPEAGPIPLTGLPRSRVEFALLRNDLGWSRAVSRCTVDLGDDRAAQVILDWPMPADPQSMATLEGRIELMDEDLPPELLQRLSLEFHLLEESGARGPRVARKVSFGRFQRIESAPAQWTFATGDMIAGTYALVLHPFGYQSDVVLYPGHNHASLHIDRLARTLLELTDSAGESIHPPNLRVVRSDPSGAHNENLPVYVARVPDGVGYLVWSLPGRLDVTPRENNLWPTSRTFVVGPGWNHVAMDCQHSCRLELRTLRRSTPTTMSDAWWDELNIAAPSSGGEVLAMGRWGVRPEGSMGMRLTLSAPGDWRLTFRATDGQTQDLVAHLNGEGTEELFLELEPDAP